MTLKTLAPLLGLVLAAAPLHAQRLPPLDTARRRQRTQVPRHVNSCAATGCATLNRVIVTPSPVPAARRPREAVAILRSVVFFRIAGGVPRSHHTTHR